MNTLSPLRRQPFAWLAVGLCAASIAACGGSAEPESSSGSTPASSSSGGTGDDDAGRVRLQQCLRENGVDVPDNPGQGGGGGNIDREALQEAIEGPCKEFQSEGFGNISEEDQQEMQDQFQKFSQCMRDEGVDVPDMGSGGGPPGGGEQLDQDDPDVQAAMEKCQGQLPQGAGPGGGGGQE
jgi:hypothetical protein